tara:strand:+ start:570 stop:1316 length:747 start_codon:yes stop_codon:yes gene_type:complete
MLANDGSGEVISHASGFFWRHEGRIFLVSARHVLSGRNPFTNELMSPDGFIPHRLRVFPTIEAAPSYWQRWQLEGDLYTDGEPEWLDDPQFDELRTDIAAVEMSAPPDGNTLRCMNDNDGLESPLFSMVGFECSIVGYPQAAIGGMMTPVWRRATIASEPSLPVDGKPMFLLDASTSPGFSGAPVFRRHIGPAPLIDNDSDEITIDLDAVVRTSFVGIYAGRLAHSHFGGEVPFVFYANRLPHIFGQL